MKIVESEDSEDNIIRVMCFGKFFQKNVGACERKDGKRRILSKKTFYANCDFESNNAGFLLYNPYYMVYFLMIKYWSKSIKYRPIF